MSKKLSTPITDANGGMHSPVNYRKAMNMLKTHPYANGRLYHIVLTGSEDRKVYQQVVELLCKELRANKMPCRYKACYERDKWKRFHMHIFLLIESEEVNPDSILHYMEGHFFTELTKALKVKFTIAEPDNPIHHVAGKQVNYAYVPKKASPKLDDCLVWISYLYKVRSKEGVSGQIYTASTNREGKKSVPPSAPQADKETFSQISLKVVTVRQKHPPHSIHAKESKNEKCTETSHGTNQEGEACTSPSEGRYSLPSVTALVSPRPSATEACSSPGEPSSIRYGSGASTHHREEGSQVKLTPAQTYVASLYERCIDSEMDVDAIRLYLLERGIKRSPAMVAHELEEVFCFPGYAASHMPVPAVTVTQWDALKS